MGNVFRIIGGPYDDKFLEIRRDSDPKSPRAFEANDSAFIFPKGSKFGHLDESSSLGILDSIVKLEAAILFESCDVEEALSRAADEDLDANACLDIIDAYAHAVTLPIFCHDHGGISLSSDRFQDSWDSGQVGWAVMEQYQVTVEFQDNIPRAVTSMKSEIENFSHYLNGDVFEIVMYDANGIEVYSNSGYYGNDYRTNGMQADIEFDDLAEVKALPGSLDEV